LAETGITGGFETNQFLAQVEDCKSIPSGRSLKDKGVSVRFGSKEILKERHRKEIFSVNRENKNNSEETGKENCFI